MPTTIDRLPLSVRIQHRLGVALVTLGYVTSESLKDSASAVDWHVLSGLGLLLIIVPRLWLHWRYRARFSAHQTGATNRFARFTHLALLAYLLVQPVIGILAMWAEGDPVPVPFTSWAVGPLLSSVLGNWPQKLHEELGHVFYLVIALHVGAALWHHFARRNVVLRRML